jgi:hypothetical protein
MDQGVNICRSLYSSILFWKTKQKIKILITLHATQVLQKYIFISFEIVMIRMFLFVSLFASTFPSISYQKTIQRKEMLASSFVNITTKLKTSFDEKEKSNSNIL